MEAIVELHLARLGVVVDHQRTGVVDQQLAGGAAEVAERAFQPLHPGRLALVQEHAHVGAARVAQGGDEQVQLHGLTAHRHAQAAEVDLQLVTWRGLETHGGGGLRQHFPAQVGDRARTCAS